MEKTLYGLPRSRLKPGKTYSHITSGCLLHRKVYEDPKTVCGYFGIYLLLGTQRPTYDDNSAFSEIARTANLSDV